jgi:hypothetical protein
MKWYSVLFFLGTTILIVGASTEENSAPSMTAVDQIRSLNSKIHEAQIAVTNLGRFPYQDYEVILYQNPLKLTDFFFTPFPQVEPNLTECSDNKFSGRTELTLFVSLYTTDLLQSVERHIKNRHAICQTESCEISLLPIQSIRLIQKRLQTTESKTKYTSNSEWQNNTPLQKTVQFTIYTSNMSTCESLQNAIASRCRLSEFEVQYKAIPVKTRTHLNVLPLRCPYEYRNRSLENDHAAEKYDQLLNAFHNLRKDVDARYDLLFNAVSNLTDIVKKTEQSTNASINRIMGDIRSKQIGKSYTTKSLSAVDRKLIVRIMRTDNF